MNDELEERVIRALLVQSFDTRIHDMQQVILDMRRELDLVKETAKPYTKDWIWIVERDFDPGYTVIFVQCFRHKRMYLRVPIKNLYPSDRLMWDVLEGMIDQITKAFERHILYETRKFLTKL